ncbi:hypothetical protein ACFSKL_13145 [Belliella marina]|uniref:Uncharacterized protein n=1 Tax=Belliella marina TaxID=1644146 RepID=A0ABW4VR04_9BACT
MKNTLTIISALMLIISALIIQSLMEGSKPLFDLEMIRFFTGLCWGTGVGLLLLIVFGNRKKKNILSKSNGDLE